MNEDIKDKFYKVEYETSIRTGNENYPIKENVEDYIYEDEKQVEAFIVADTVYTLVETKPISTKEYTANKELLELKYKEAKRLEDENQLKKDLSKLGLGEYVDIKNFKIYRVLGGYIYSNSNGNVFVDELIIKL